jgi:iron uptake system component EfeO
MSTRTTPRALAPALALLALACSTTKEAAPPPPQPAAPTPFATALSLGLADLNQRSEDLVASVEKLLGTIVARDIAAARTAYVRARAPYEEIEVLRNEFPELHLAIDGRPSDFAQGALDPDFGGFHAVELALFGRDDLDAALPHARALYEDVQALRDELRSMTQPDPATVFATMIERTGEVAWKTITSEEETWSNATLTVIRHNWIGVHSIYRHFVGQLRQRDGILAEQIDRAYRRALEVIASDFPIGEVQGTPYNIVDRAKRRKIVDASITLRARLIDAARALELETADA